MKILFLIYSLSISLFAQQPAFLKIGNGAEPQTLDPALATGVVESALIDNLFAGIVEQDPLTLEPIPGLAKSWTISADGKVYQFQLREGLKWSDGQPLTADDIIWSWLRTLRPATAAPYAYKFYPIVGAAEFNQGKAKDTAQVGLKATNSMVEICLTKPNATFLQLLGFMTFRIAPRHVIERCQANQQEWTKPQHLVASGAFKLNEWKLNQRIQLVANSHYWDASNVKLAGAEFYPISDVDIEEKQFITNRLHLTQSVPLAKIPSYRQDPQKSKVLRIDPMFAITFLALNLKQKPLTDTRVRQALNMAIDRRQLTEYILQAGEKPALNIVPNGIGTYVSPPSALTENATPAQISKAKELLQAAGYADASKLQGLVLTYSSGGRSKKVLTAIQDMWRKHLGVQVEFNELEWKVYLDKFRTREFSLLQLGWIGDAVDPEAFLNIFQSSNENNASSWQQPNFDQHLLKASETLNTNERYQQLQQAERLLLEEVPVIPLYHVAQAHLVSPQLRIHTPQQELIPWRANGQGRLFLRHYVL